MLFHVISYSQITIKGRILDKNTNEELIGSNIIIKETNTGVSSDNNGFFSIKKPNNIFPIHLTVSYIGYEKKEIVISKQDWSNMNMKDLIIYLNPDNKLIKEINVVDSRLTLKQKESPLTIEALDIISIKETPSVNFYDGLGALKGVDISAASLGFKIINTRGFNSTSPVRSLQIIDGVDNQAPGMNFSLGNFLGSSELDIQKVEIIQGASSAYFGPNAFNGVIKMETKDPFIHTGIDIQTKFGNRNLYENSIRISEKFKNIHGIDVFAYKINLSYMQAYDWEANNLNPVDGTNNDINNPGGYDAVNIYGDEDTDGDLNNMTDFRSLYVVTPGLGKYHRTGYLESDIVDYNTDNLKFSTSLHYKINDDITAQYKLNYGTGTTVYQGDNRYSLKNIEFFQNIIEIKQLNKFFIKLYNSKEDAGDSYDAVFTAIRLQEHNQTTNEDWYAAYKNNWRNNFQWSDIGWSVNGPFFDPNTFSSVYEFNGIIVPSSEVFTGIAMSDSVLNANIETIISSHDFTRFQTDLATNRLIPGTEDFQNSLNDITSRISYLDGGTGFYDKSALTHIHGEYIFNIDEKNTKNYKDRHSVNITTGFNIRRYNPDSRGSIFMDTVDKIQNLEYGIYSGIDYKSNKNLKITATLRVDKNQNFEYNFSPASTIVYTPNENDVFRCSFSSAIRNPTLSDQYLYYNVGRAILIGNLSGHGQDYGENLVTIQSLINYFLPPLEERSTDSLKFFSVDPIKTEKVKSFELGYRTTIFNKIYIDANVYYSKYKDFIGYKIGAKFEKKYNDTTETTYGISLPSIQAYRMAANAENIVSTKGASLGVNYYLSKNFTFNGNYSWNKLNLEGTEDPIIPAYNTPEHKFNLGFSSREIHFTKKPILRNYGFNINYKWIEGYEYEGSPQFTGFIPSYGLVDCQISKKIPKYSSTIKIGSTNLLNNLHYEVYGGPYIGRMNYISVLFELK